MVVAMVSFAPDHPVFSGHFPGRPIVPGVLLLDTMLRRIESDTGLAIAGIAAAKFLSPAVPGDLLELHYEVAQAAIHFEIRSGVRKIAIGRFGIASGSAA